MFLLWAGYLVINNVQFKYVVPHHHMLVLTAKKVTGNKSLEIQDVRAQYADWLFTAKDMTLNTLDHVVQLGKMTMNCKNQSVQILAQSGILYLQVYTAMIQHARLTHHNMVFTCPKTVYDHQNQKITCWNGKMVTKSYKHSYQSKGL